MSNAQMLNFGIGSFIFANDLKVIIQDNQLFVNVPSWNKR